MNTMVVHALDTAVRVFIQTRAQLDYPMLDSNHEKIIISALLKRETFLAIGDPEGSSSLNMAEFEERNFKWVMLSSDPHDDDDEYARHLPIAQVQAMRLAFANQLRCSRIRAWAKLLWGAAWGTTQSS